MWRLRYALRKARLRLIRIALRNPLALWARTHLRWLVIATLIGAAAAYAVGNPGRVGQGAPSVGQVTQGWITSGWRFMVGQLSITLDVEAGREMLQATLPASFGPAFGPEPAASWRTPLRAWVYVVTGYDFTSPHSFLESEVPGFRKAIADRLDVALIPDANRSAGQPAPDSTIGTSIPPSSGPAAHDAPGEGERGASHSVGVEQPIDPSVVDRGPQERPIEPGGEEQREPRPLPAGAPPALAALTRESWGREPLVLILHSHTSESYRTSPPDPRATSLNHIHNSSDTGIVRVGRALAQKLQDEYGIPSIHSTRIHNWPHHARAYLSSRETVQEILRENPSIKVVLDIHRQGVPNFTYATTVGDVDAVGIDIIYTTGLRAGYPNPHWTSNEAFATKLAEAMDTIHPGLLRRVMKIDDSVYNQDLHPRMLLLEVGNYLDFEEHAIAAAQLLADPLARTLHEIIASERTDDAVPALGRAIVPRRAPLPVPLRREETQGAR